MKKNKWLMLLAACAIHLSLGSIYAYSTLVLPITSETSWTFFSTISVFSIAVLFFGISALFGGNLVEKYGPIKTGVLSSVLLTIGLQGSAFAILTHNIALMYLFQGIIYGCACGIGYVAPIKCIISWFNDKPGFANGATVMMFGMAPVITIPIISRSIINFGLVNTFIILGIVYPIIMFISSFYLEYPDNIIEQDLSIESSTVNEALETTNFKLLFITFFINILCGISFLSIVSPMLQQVLNFDILRAAGFVGLLAMSNGFGRMLWSLLSDVFDGKNIIIVFSVLEIISLFVLSLDTSAHVYIYFYQIFLFMIASAYGGYFAVLPSFIIELFGKKHLPAIHGILLSALGLAGLCTLPIMYFILSDISGYNMLFKIFTLLIAGNIFLLTKIDTNKSIK